MKNLLIKDRNGEALEVDSIISNVFNRVELSFYPNVPGALEYYHIDLTVEEARKLKNWLVDYFNEDYYQNG